MADQIRNQEERDNADNNNDTSYTFMANNTPPEREDNAATDPLNEIVEKIMDNLSGEPEKEE